ncbi:ATP-dependent DNA helicase RecG [uncultured Abyssibacter sp.]|uniref:ATP-dependent DNA helicase RecG n=1 Tax=uncultured Abyssibacter sp. TaxID=2320202 RepID=UPI0032B20B20
MTSRGRIGAARTTPLTPDSPLTAFPGVGEAMATRLQQLGLQVASDLLFHLPNRYEDRTRLWTIGDLAPGIRAQLVARVERADLKFGRRRSLLVSLTDGSGRLGMRLFHFSKAQQRQFVPGQWVRIYGDARAGPVGLEMAHPEYKLVSGPDDATATEDTLTPLYPLTQGITQGRLRGMIGRALDQVLEQIDDPLADAGLDVGAYPDLHAAITTLHRPPVGSDVTLLASGYHPAQRRLALEELLAHRLSLSDLKRRAREQLRATPLSLDAMTMKPLLAQLGFSLTGAQRRVVGEIARDLDQNTPMMRLVQGDVGAGKTVIAAAALLAAVRAGRQAALMAPTELLAEQHAGTLAGWLEPLGIEVLLLSGARKAQERRAIEARLESGDPLLAVGTHALFQRSVQLPKLALVVVDEQHRFGVHQRLALLDKGADLYPHQLVMTATPIPRTLAMRAYADLDTSVLDELPPGRTPVTTIAVDQQRRDEVIERVGAACKRGRQAYWVCTLVETSDQLDAEAAEAAAERLRSDCPELRVGLVHGRMKPVDKQAVMADFKAGKIDLLVATTVIEVGVDVPNASLMVIENAERLGLAQLHQLRGRVGRGSELSHCVLMYQGPLSELAKARLAVMRETTDGFRIAERDLELRGPGEVMGTRQTGEIGLRIADMVRDADLLGAAEALAAGLGDRTDTVREVLSRRWVAGAERYARA